MNDLFNKKVTLEEINQLEKRRNIRLPGKYIHFLLTYNGGEPDPNFFEIPGQDGYGSYVDLFYGIGVPAYGDLEESIEVYTERHPEGFIPIGSDPGCNVICLGTIEPYIGKIYFWDHHDELDERGLSKTDMSNMYWLADDIDEFLNKLYEFQEE
jgi:hypothetical protein